MECAVGLNSNPEYDRFELDLPRLPWYRSAEFVKEGQAVAYESEQAMNVREVASYLNVDEKTVYRLAKRGGLPGFKVAGAWRFKHSDLDAWIDCQKQAAVNNAKSEAED